VADIQRAPEDDPNRCQGTAKGGQCQNYALRDKEGNFISKYCIVHGGFAARNAAEKQRIRKYYSTKWAAKIARYAEDKGVKSLRDEIGILRMMLDERLEQINDELGLVKAMGPISELILKIEKLVTSCHRLEEKMGATLDKSAVMGLADQILNIIAVNLENADLDAKDQENLLLGITTGIENIFRDGS
jgi:hypothetical protein